MPSSANRQLREQGLEPVDVTFFLIHSDRIIQYFCLFCRRGLFKTQRRVISVVYGEGMDVPQNPPISLQCPGCGNRIHIHGMNA